MQDKFESNGNTFDVEYFTKDNGVMVRFYDKKHEHTALSNLVIITPPFGTLLVQYIGDDVIVGGTLNNKYFNPDMIEDMIAFLEDNFPKCKGVCFPYHIDFMSETNFDEYNGEY